MKDLFVKKHISGGNLPVNEYQSSRGAFQTPFVNFMVFSNTPHWQKLHGIQSLFDWYHQNPVLYATINIKARADANKKYLVLNRKTGKIEPTNTQKEIPKKVYSLMENPNVLQARGEFNKQNKIFSEVAGNSFRYGNFSTGFNRNVLNCEALWNVWPAYMQFKLAGNYFEATKIEDIIKEWRFEAGKYKKIWQPHEILHRNEPNTNLNQGLIFGRAVAESLTRPLSNIDMAYESRNVIMKNRGMRVMVTSNKTDASGNVPLLDDESKSVDEAMKKYGLLENQSQFFFSPMPLNAVPIDQDVMKLGLFEEIATDGIIVCNAFGVPEVLLKLYIKGATFENQEASERRLYQGTIIPEADEDTLALNRFLGLDQTDWMLIASFDHVSVLQETEEKKADAKKKKSDQLLGELAKNIIDIHEYRALMEYDPKPKPADDKEKDKDTRTLESQATLRGSVGGVQAILAIQLAVQQGQSTRESAIAMLIYIFGFTEEQANELIGEIKENANAGNEASTSEENNSGTSQETNEDEEQDEQ